MSSGLIKVIVWPYYKFRRICGSINTIVEGPLQAKESGAKLYDYMTKLVGVSIGGVGAGKGTADAVEALVCGDGICFVVSCVGVAADGLQVAASFVPGPNLTTVVTLPISLGCKTFVWACKKSKLPWRSAC
jgi:hypothetical protein